MTTISSTNGTSPTYTPPASSSASTPGSTGSSQAYNGKAAVAQAQALAAQQLADGASGSQGSLLGLSSDILGLLQGGSGTSLVNTLLGGTSGNSFLAAQSQLALYGAAQKRAAAAQAKDPVSDLIAANNAALNAANGITIKDSSAPSANTSA